MRTQDDTNLRSCGVEFFDRQHAELAACLDRIVNLDDWPRGLEAAKQELLKFTRGIRRHFKEEEAFLEGYRPDDLDEHRKKHDDLLKELEKDVREICTNDPFMLRSYAWLTLYPWLTDHIEDLDASINADGPYRSDQRGHRRRSDTARRTLPERRGRSHPTTDWDGVERRCSGERRSVRRRILPARRAADKY